MSRIKQFCYHHNYYYFTIWCAKILKLLFTTVRAFYDVCRYMAIIDFNEHCIVDREQCYILSASVLHILCTRRYSYIYFVWCDCVSYINRVLLITQRQETYVVLDKTCTREGGFVGESVTQ